MELDDLIQVGRIALDKMIDRYEIGTLPFDRCVSIWIKGSMQDAIRDEIWNQSDASRSNPKIKKAYDRFVQLHFGKKPTMQQLMETTELPEKAIVRYLNSGFTISFDELDETDLIDQNKVSDQIFSPETHLIQKTVVSKLHSIMRDAKLSDCQIQVLERSYGLGMQEEQTLNIIAKDI